MTTRVDPPLAHSRLRIGEQLTEVRVRDLRFTEEETSEFFQETGKFHLQPASISAVEERTEGWVAGLQLVALSLKGLEVFEIPVFIEKFGGSHRYIIDYLMEEVLRNQEAHIREFLYMTALLERFCAPLCEAVTGSKDSKNILEQLEKTNLFLISLDPERQWYRYHHLFADFLRTQTEESTRVTLHRKIAQWYETHGYLREAVTHVLLAGETLEAIRLISDIAGQMLAEGQLRTLFDWLESLPDEEVCQNATVRILKAWGFYSTGQLEDCLGYISGITDDMFQGMSVRDRGRLICLKSYLASNYEPAMALALACQALELVDETDAFFRIMALIAYGQEQYYTGESNIAVDAEDKALEALGQAIELAATDEYVRPFLGDRRAVARLLPKLGGIAPVLQARLLTDLRTAGMLEAEGQATEGTIGVEVDIDVEAQGDVEVEESLIEPLSNREMEILQMISDGASNKDISEKLYISIGTVKWHINNIYGKLGVDRRTQAVDQARKLRLIK